MEEPVDDKRVRQEYTELTNETIRRQEDDDFLIQSLDKADKLNESVSRPREAKYDSNFMKAQSYIVKHRISSLSTSLDIFDPKAFAEKLSTNFDSRARVDGKSERQTFKHWDKLGNAARNILTTAPAFHYMYGLFEPGTVELKRKARKAKRTDVESKVQQPKLVDNNSKAPRDESVAYAHFILEILKRLYEKNNRQAICYIEFVVNPESFSQTVENLFYVSTLVGLAKAQIFLDNNKLPFIEPIPEDKRNDVIHHGKAEQFAMSMNMDDWEALVADFNIKKSAIPTRKH